MSMKTPEWSPKDLFSPGSISDLVDSFGRKIVTFEDSSPSNVGKLLSETRMRCGFEKRSTAKKLRINLRYIAAIEDGRFKELPGKVYAIGFVRAYANYLGLDGEEVIRLFKKELSQVGYDSPYALPILSSDTGRPGGTTILLAITMAVVVYAAWYLTTYTGRLGVSHVHEVPVGFATRNDLPFGSKVDVLAAGSPSRLNTILITEPRESVINDEDLNPADQPLGFLPASPETSVTPSQPLTNVRQFGSKPKTLATKSENIMVSAVSGVVNKLVEQDYNNVQLGAQISASDGATERSGSEAAVSGTVIRLRAISDGWIQVREGKHLLLTLLLKKGEIYQLPEQPDLTLITSNAGGLEVLIDGHTRSILRDEGAIKRGVAINLDNLRSGSY